MDKTLRDPAGRSIPPEVLQLLALQDHAPQCQPCIHDAGSCTTGTALRYLMRGWRP
ncbi:hypothetical protein AB0D49_13250 [Streptomyces sp. NPDC048290]|uniref:hypothetical protein n=1 Tax=Streptomyces sp. NPDC048290 TaxID=3155811 RepID=UPI0034305687